MDSIVVQAAVHVFDSVILTHHSNCTLVQLNHCAHSVLYVGQYTTCYALEEASHNKSGCSCWGGGKGRRGKGVMDTERERGGSDWVCRRRDRVGSDGDREGRE